jgi:hypothetical protein
MLLYRGFDVLTSLDGSLAEQDQPSIAFMKHLLDSVRGGVPALMRAMRDTVTDLRCAMPNRPGCIRRPMSDCTGRVRRTVPDIAGTVANALSCRLRVLLDVLADGTGSGTRRVTEQQAKATHEHDAEDLLVVHAMTP